MEAPNRWNVDVPLLAGLVVLCGLGLVVLYSAGGENVTLLLRQGVRIAVAFLALFALAQVPPATLVRWSPYVFAGGLALLGAVLATGIVGKGAQRWLDLGLFRFQPAEIMKLAVPMMVAWLLTRNPLPPRLRDLLLATVAVVAPSLLIVLQPDLGTAVLIAVSGLLVIFLAGIGWRYIALVTVLGANRPQGG